VVDLFEADYQTTLRQQLRQLAAYSHLPLEVFLLDLKGARIFHAQPEYLWRRH
jgi:hypothetical protein